MPRRSDVVRAATNDRSEAGSKSWVVGRHGRVLGPGVGRSGHGDGQHEMLGQPGRLEAEPVGRLGGLDPQTRVQAPEGDGELHADPPDTAAKLAGRRGPTWLGRRALRTPGGRVPAHADARAGTAPRRGDATADRHEAGRPGLAGRSCLQPGLLGRGRRARAVVRRARALQRRERPERPGLPEHRHHAARHRVQHRNAARRRRPRLGRGGGGLPHLGRHREPPAGGQDGTRRRTRARDRPTRRRRRRDARTPPSRRRRTTSTSTWSASRSKPTSGSAPTPWRTPVRTTRSWWSARRRPTPRG